MADHLILITGANGYIAGKLIPHLLEAGYRVRCMVRDPEKLIHLPWVGQVDIIAADVSDPSTLGPALDQVDTAYYLIHNMSSGPGYQQIELASAKNFAQAAAQAGMRHIIYLGGLADTNAKIAPHLRSRIDTGEILRQNPVPVTEFRAGVIVGPGSISFEMIRYLCEQFPILVGPAWLKNRTQPISVENVVDYLMAALESSDGHGQILEIGGSETHTYAETMLIYSKIRKLRRWLLTVPTLPIALMAYIVDKLTPIPSAIAYPLIEGLNSHSAVTDLKVMDVFPEIEPSGYRQAVQDSLAMLHPNQLERTWIGQKQPHVSLKSEGFLITCHQVHIALPAGEITQRVGEWTADHLPGFDYEEMQENRRLLFRDSTSKSGTRWIEWELLPQTETSTLLRQTGYFAPKGLAGFLSAHGWKKQDLRLFRQICKQLGGFGKELPIPVQPIY